MKKKRLISFLFIVGFLILFYYLGMPLEVIILFGVLILILLLFKTTIYRKIDKLIRKHFKFFSKLPKWLVKLIIIIIFILIYILVKQAIFAILKMFGVDIEGMILEGINQSLEK